MLFFALVAMFVCFQASWRASKQNQDPPETSANAPPNTPGGEAYVPFSLPTSEEAGEGSDEEVAVEFHRTPPRQSYTARAMDRDPHHAVGGARDHRLGRAVAAVETPTAGAIAGAAGVAGEALIEDDVPDPRV